MVQGWDHSHALQKAHLRVGILEAMKNLTQFLASTYKENEDFIPGQELAHAVAPADAEGDHSLALDVPESHLDVPEPHQASF